jgi:predicted ester cyclase
VVDQSCAFINERRLDELLEQCDAQCRVALPNGDALAPQDFADFYRALFIAFPDLRCEILRVLEAGDAVAVELRFSGTNTGPFHTGVNQLPATGTRVEYRSCELIRLRAGKIAEWCTYFDQVALFGQLGWM